jgi:hypothetical protein
MKLDRSYFKEKHTGKKPESQYTICCNQLVDRDILNKNNKDDYELMEGYCEASLQQHTAIDHIKIECCEECGRLIKYVSVLTQTRDNWK